MYSWCWCSDLLPVNLITEELSRKLFVLVFLSFPLRTVADWSWPNVPTFLEIKSVFLCFGTWGITVMPFYFPNLIQTFSPESWPSCSMQQQSHLYAPCICCCSKAMQYHSTVFTPDAIHAVKTVVCNHPGPFPFSSSPCRGIPGSRITNIWTGTLQ